MHPAVRFRSFLMVALLSVPTFAQDKQSDSSKTVDGKAAKAEKTEPASAANVKRADGKEAKKQAPAAKKESPEPKIGVRQIKISGDYVDLVQPAGLDPLSLLGGAPWREAFLFQADTVSRQFLG